MSQISSHWRTTVILLLLPLHDGVAQTCERRSKVPNGNKKNSPIGSRVIDDEKLNRCRCFRNFFGRKHLHGCIRSEIGSSVRARNQDGLGFRVVSAQDIEHWSRCPKIDGQVNEECRALSFAVRLEVLGAEIRLQNTGNFAFK
jgi:hypothetical protein